MTKIIDNTPPYAEEIILNQEAEQIQEILSQFKHPIPSGFVELGQPKKYWGSTEGLDKPLCERYTFKYNNKSVTLDIVQELNNKLELSSKENFYVAEEVLSRATEERESVITIDSEKEIFLHHLFTIDNLEKNLTKLFEKIEKLETEKELNQEIINDLKKELAEAGKVKKIWQDKYLTEKGNSEYEVKAKMSELIAERDNIRQELNNQQVEVNHLQNEITRLNNTLQNTQQEKDQIQQSLKRSLLSSLFKDKQKRQRINELNNSLAFLRSLLKDKNQQANDLIAERNNLQTQINDLNRRLNEADNLIQASQNEINQSKNEINQLTNKINDLEQRLTNANNSIANKDNEITRLENKVREIERERDRRPNIDISWWNDTRQQLAYVQGQLTNTRTDLTNTKNELNDYRNKWDNHTCHCSREHYSYYYNGNTSL